MLATTIKACLPFFIQPELYSDAQTADVTAGDMVTQRYLDSGMSFFYRHLLDYKSRRGL